MSTYSGKTPRLKAPAGACDTHIHIYNSRYPTAPTAKMTPPDVSVEDYKAMCTRVGIERTVVVQPTTYAKDNRCTLEAVAELGDNGRGVVVVDEHVPLDELARMTKAGIRGVRFFMLPGGALAWESLDAIAARFQDFGWHSVVQLDGRDLSDRESAITRLPGTIIIDHTGKFLEPVSPDHHAFRTLLRMLENGRTYVKLAAPYEVSKVGAPTYSDVGALAKALVKAAPERIVWASNFPHPSASKEQRPDDADMLDLLLDWAPDDATRKKILVDNPARLYGF